MLKVGPYKYNDIGGYIKFGRYANDQVAIQVLSSKGIESIATVALVDPKSNLGDKNDTHCWLKGWSENEGLPEALEKAGIIRYTGETFPTGHTFAILGKFTDSALEELELQKGE